MVQNIYTCELIHHSGRGVQYASSEYIKTLMEHNIKNSMTENGDPKENAQTERINNTMKNELLKGKRFHSIDMLTPAQAARCEGPINKLWTSYRELAIQTAKEEISAQLNNIP